MKYEKTDIIEIPKKAFVTVKEFGGESKNSMIEISYNSNPNLKSQIKKISSEEYVVNSTGEIKQYEKKSATRADNPESVRKTLRRIRELIQNNVTDTKKAKFITLTYSEQQTSLKVLYEDFRRFNQKFYRYMLKRGFNKPEYISVAEPQQRGAWHIHIIYILDVNFPYVDNEDISKLWGKGFTKTKKIDSVTNVASYLMAYLTDLEIPEENKPFFDESEIKEIEVDGKKKSFVKGFRLRMYKSGANLLRHSSGIKYPVAKKMTLEAAEELITDRTLTYHTSYRLSNEDGYSTLIDKKEYRYIKN